MKNIFYLFLFITPFLASCTTYTKQHNEAYRLMNAFTRKAQSEDNLTLFGIGGSLPSNVKKLILSFTSTQKLDIQQARIQFIKSTQKLLKMVNCDKKIYPLLNNYPFTECNIEFAILYRDEKNKFLTKPYIAHVFNIGNKIYYNSYDPNVDMLIDEYEETYQEALQIVIGECR